MGQYLLLSPRKREFTLLEVLIAILLVTFALPLLTAPFLYTARNYEADLDDAYLEKAAGFALVGLLGDLHKGRKLLGSFDAGLSHPGMEEWFSEAFPSPSGLTVTYTLRKLKPSQKSEEEKTQNVELWEVSFLLKKGSKLPPTKFDFKFIAVREK